MFTAGKEIHLNKGNMSIYSLKNFTLIKNFASGTKMSIL